MISPTHGTSVTITENSKLIGDVSCTVVGAPCITFGVSGLTLDLNGYNLGGAGGFINRLQRQRDRE